MKRIVISAAQTVLVLGLLVPPIVAAFVPEQFLPYFFIPLGLLALAAVSMFYGPLRHGVFTFGREYRSFERLHEFARAVVSAPDALWLGSITGALYASLVLLTAYLVKLSHKEFNWAEKLPDATAAFLAGLSTFLIINYFYRRYAPYKDLWELLERIREDARSLTNEQTRRAEVIWVYPGFGLGYYRALKRGDRSKDSDVQEYARFKSALQNLFLSPSVKLTAITYSIDQLTAFFCSYHLQNAAIPYGDGGGYFVDPAMRDVSPAGIHWNRVLHEPVVQLALAEETELSNVVRSNLSNDLYWVGSPDDMPLNLIVIDDIVYNLSSFGFPLFYQRPATELVPPFTKIRGFFEVNQKDNLIRLLAFRTQDRALADAVKSHIANFITLGTSHGLLKRVTGLAPTIITQQSSTSEPTRAKGEKSMRSRLWLTASLVVALIGGALVWRAMHVPPVLADGHILIEVASIVEIEPIRELREGFVEELSRSPIGNRVDYVERNAQGETGNVNQIAAEVGRLQPRAVYVLGTPLAQAIQKQNPTVLMFQGAVTDPVAAGLAKSWDGSGRPYAATSDRPPVGRILDTVTRLTPGKRRLGVIYNPGESNSVAVVSALRAAAGTKGYLVHEYGVGGVQDLPTTIASAIANSDVIFIPPDNTVTSGLKALIARAIASHVPVYATTSDAVKLGALASVSTNFKQLGRETADIAYAVLAEGKNAGSIPIQLPKSQEIIVNAQTARTLGVSLAPAHSAGYVIQ